jgi:excisionase family DNA binding protein
MEQTELMAGYLTPNEAAAALHICKRTLERWVTERSGPPRFKVGRTVYYNFADLESWLAKQREPGAEHKTRRRR